MSIQIPQLFLDIIYQWSQTFLQTYNIDDNITKEPLDHVVLMFNATKHVIVVSNENISQKIFNSEHKIPPIQV